MFFNAQQLQPCRHAQPDAVWCSPGATVLIQLQQQQMHTVVVFLQCLSSKCTQLLAPASIHNVHEVSIPASSNSVRFM
jgi:hypothetical protein